LTCDNSAYGNKSFVEKKGKPGLGNPCYADSSLFQERELASFDEWTAETIEKRREKIVKWALSRWHVDATGTRTMPPDIADDDFD
jgi:hypothetical protein